MPYATCTFKKADPDKVRIVWQKLDDLIRKKCITESSEKILKFFTQKWNVSDIAVVNIFDQMVHDSLLDCKTNSENDLTIPSYSIILRRKSTIEPLAYYLPDFQSSSSLQKSTHDGYCFHCHSGGEVVPCAQCFRVYHITCLEINDNATDVNCNSNKSLVNTFICPCHVTMPTNSTLSRKQVRKLLDFVTFHCRKQDPWKNKFYQYGFVGDFYRNHTFFYKYIDTAMLQQKIFDGRYLLVQDFLADVMILIHNVCLHFGSFSKEADDARFMLRSLQAHIQEAQYCYDCFINSKAKVNDWMSKPCEPLHELIWAKYPCDSESYHKLGNYFWPAKIIFEKENGFEVRFFGGVHERHFVLKQNTLSFTKTTNEVSIKRGIQFDRAWNEVTKLKNNVSNGYYSHSSGESDLPSSDEDADERYIQLRIHSKVVQKQVKRVSSQNRKRHATSVCSASLDVKSVSSSSAVGLSSTTDSIGTHRKRTRKASGNQLNVSLLPPVERGISSAGSISSCSSNKPSHVKTDAQDNNCPKVIMSSVEIQTDPEAPLIHYTSKCNCQEEFEKKLANALELERQNSVELLLKQKMEFELEKESTMSKFIADCEQNCKLAMIAMRQEMDEKSSEAVDTAKRRQWCRHCLKEAIYHCCWNTAYCSISCQQSDWQMEHKQSCRRKKMT